MPCYLGADNRRYHRWPIRERSAILDGLPWGTPAPSEIERLALSYEDDTERKAPLAPAADKQPQAPRSTRAEQRVTAPGQVEIALTEGGLRSIPPPLPAAPPKIEAPPAPPSVPPPPPGPAGKRRVWLWLLIAALVLSASATLGVVLKLKIVPAPIRQVVTRLIPRAVQPASATVIELPLSATSGDAGQCVAAHFPTGTLEDDDKLSFVCNESDAWQIAQRLQRVITSHGPTEGAALWETLGFYDLAAVTVMRSRCCMTVTAMSAVVAPNECGDLTTPLQALGSNPTAETLRTYEDTVHCLIERQVRLPEHFTEVAQKPMQAAVKRFFPGASTN